MLHKVLCLTKRIYCDEQELWLSRDSLLTKQIFIPLYDHPHNDVENGQREIHYHQNSKFNCDDSLYFKSYKSGRISFPFEDGEYLSYQYLEQIRDSEIFTTPLHLIKNTKLKHKCIHKNKCPHRGYNLSNELPDKNEIITCPLHGLKFDKNKNIINYETNQHNSSNP